MTYTRWKSFALDYYDEAEAKLFAAENTNDQIYGLEKDLIESNNNGGLPGVVQFMLDRPVFSSYKDYDVTGTDVEQFLGNNDYNVNDSWFDSSGKSTRKEFIMQNPRL